MVLSRRCTSADSRLCPLWSTWLATSGKRSSTSSSGMVWYDPPSSWSCVYQKSHPVGITSAAPARVYTITYRQEGKGHTRGGRGSETIPVRRPFVFVRDTPCRVLRDTDNILGIQGYMVEYIEQYTLH